MSNTITNTTVRMTAAERRLAADKARLAFMAEWEARQMLPKLTAKAEVSALALQLHKLDEAAAEADAADALQDAGLDIVEMFGSTPMAYEIVDAAIRNVEDAEAEAAQAGRNFRFAERLAEALERQAAKARGGKAEAMTLQAEADYWAQEEAELREICKTLRIAEEKLAKKLAAKGIAPDGASTALKPSSQKPCHTAALALSLLAGVEPGFIKNPALATRRVEVTRTTSGKAWEIAIFLPGLPREAFDHIVASAKAKDAKAVVRWVGQTVVMYHAVKSFTKRLKDEAERLDAVFAKAKADKDAAKAKVLANRVRARASKLAALPAPAITASARKVIGTLGAQTLYEDLSEGDRFDRASWDAYDWT